MDSRVHECADCGKQEELAYKTWWYRVKKGSGRCNSCSKKGLGFFKKGHKSWNTGLKGYGTWPKWYPIGEQNPFYGKVHSLETKNKMRLAKVGKKRGTMPEVTKRKIAISNRGKLRPLGQNHWNWKGGITTENRKERLHFRNSWQRLVFERDDYTCVVCNVRGGYLQVDHVKSWSEFPDLRFELDNCRTLCMSCHYRLTFKREKPDGVIWGHNLNHARRVA